MIKKTDEIAEKNLINPILEHGNKISFRWDKENKNYYMLINDQQINKKVPVSFIEEVKKCSSFLNQFTTKEIYNDNLKGGVEIPTKLIVNGNGVKSRALDQELGNSHSLSM